MAAVKNHRRMWQVRVTLAVGLGALGRKVAHLQFHVVAVGQHDQGQHFAAVFFAPGPVGHGLQHHLLSRVALAGVAPGGELGFAEDVHHAVVADAVARTEVFVGVVVKHAPANGATDDGVLVRLVQHIQVACHMFGLAVFGVDALGGVHVAVELGDEVGHLMVQAGHLAGLAQRCWGNALHPLGRGHVAEVIDGVHVFQQLAVFDVAHATGLAGAVQAARHGVGAGVEVVVVLRLVDAHAPDDDGGVVPVALDHAAHVFHRLVLPSLATDVLPARDLFKHQQADLVAAVQKVGGLRVVRGAHQVALEHVFHHVSVFFLRALAHGVAHVGEALVAVQAADLDVFVIEEKALGGEARSAKAEAGAELVAVVQGGAHQVQLGCVQLPELEAGQLLEVRFKASVRHDHGLLLEHLAIHVAEFHHGFAADSSVGGVGDETLDSHALGVRQFVGSFHLEVGNRHRVGYLQPHIAVDAGVGEVIDLAAEGGNLGVLAAVHLHGDEVVAFFEQTGEAGVERGVAVFVGRHLLAVDPDHAVGHGAIKAQCHFAAGKCRLPGQGVLVGKFFLECAFVEVGHVQVDGVVRQAHGFAGNGLGDELRRKRGVKGPARDELGNGTHVKNLI